MVNQQNLVFDASSVMANQKTEEEYRAESEERKRKISLFRYTNPIKYAQTYPNRLIIPIVLILLYFSTKKKLFIGGAIAMYILQD